MEENIITNQLEQQIERLKQEQLQHLAVMAESDAHLMKCLKFGLNFKTEYPEDYERYAAANKAYNDNESALVDISVQLLNTL